MRIDLIHITAVCLSLVASPRLAAASGDSETVVKLPVVAKGGKLKFLPVTYTYPHYYAGAITKMAAIFTPPCTADKSEAESSCDYPPGYGACAPYKKNCRLINPLSLSGIVITTETPPADEHDWVKDCDVTIDLSKLKGVSTKKYPHLASLGYAKKRNMVMLAIRTYERNTRRKLRRCPITYRGLDKHPSLLRRPLPKLLHPKRRRR